MGLWLCAFLLQGCELIEYHPYDTRIEGETGLTAKNVRLIEEKTRGKREFRFAMISDTQRRYDETEEVVDLEKPRDFDPCGQTGLSPLATI